MDELGRAEERMGWQMAGERIRRAREGHEWSQSELANKVSQSAGRDVKQRAVSKWENGDGRPSMVYVSALEEVLGLRRGTLWHTYYPEADIARKEAIASQIRHVKPFDESGDVPEGAAGSEADLDDLIAERDRIEQLIRKKLREES